MMERFKARFSKPPKDTYILVKEGNYGIEMYVNEYLSRFNKAYKEQLITFLKGIIDMLEQQPKK